MGTLIRKIIGLFQWLNNCREKWLQSRLREYVKDFRERAGQHREYWYEKIAEFLFAKIVTRGIITVPNLISLFRGIMAFPLLIFVLDGRYLFALLFFIFIMLLDMIDGPLARILEQESDLGEILDPLGDKLVFAVIFLTLGLKYLPPTIFWSSFGLEIFTVFIALGLRPIAKRLKLNFKKKANLPGKIKLWAQVIGCGCLLLHRLQPSRWLLSADVFFIISLGLSVISILNYFLTIKKRPQ